MTTAVIDLWRVDLDDSRWDAWERVLGEGERSNAAQFRSALLGARWRRGRSALRRVLAFHTGLEADCLQLVADPFGKPALADTPVHFNMTHTAGWALIAVAPIPLGIDLELARRPDIAVGEIVPLACHPDEAAILLSLPEPAANAALMRLWTQKEAYVKALGTGLQHDLTAVRIAADGRPERSVASDAHAGAARRYFIHEVDAPPGCVASLCADSRKLILYYREASVLLHAPGRSEQAYSAGQQDRIDKVAGTQGTT